MPWAVRVTRISEEMGLDEGRMPRPYIRVEFMVGDHGPFVHRFPKDQFQPELARAHLEQFGRDLERIVPG